jgi:hypothetical protein
MHMAGTHLVWLQKLEGSTEGWEKIAIDDASITISLRYLDDTASHPHQFQLKPGAKKYLPTFTEDTGIFSGFVMACDDLKYSDYNHDAQFNVHFNGGRGYKHLGPFPPASSNMLFHVKICPPLNQTQLPTAH